MAPANSYTTQQKRNTRPQLPITIHLNILMSRAIFVYLVA